MFFLKQVNTVASSLQDAEDENITNGGADEEGDKHVSDLQVDDNDVDDNEQDKKQVIECDFDKISILQTYFRRTKKRKGT